MLRLLALLPHESDSARRWEWQAGCENGVVGGRKARRRGAAAAAAEAVVVGEGAVAADHLSM